MGVLRLNSWVDFAVESSVLAVSGAGGRPCGLLVAVLCFVVTVNVNVNNLLAISM